MSNNGDENVHVNLSRFKPDKTTNPHPTIVLIGKRNAGKSTMSVTLAEEYNAPKWAAWCGTKKAENFWAKKFGSRATVKGKSQADLNYLVRLTMQQEERINLYTKVLNEPVPESLTLGMVFDDVTSDAKFSRNPILKDLFSNGRHYHVVILVCCQYVKHIPPEMRENSDYIIMLRSSKKTFKYLYEDFIQDPEEFSMFMDLAKFVINMKNTDGNKMYNGLLFNSNATSDDLNDLFYVAQSKKHIDDVELGCPEWRVCMQDEYVDVELENLIKQHKKKEKKKRQEQYRARQESRMRDGGQEFGLSFDAEDDVFSDDSEDSDEGISDSIYNRMIKNKKGKGFQVSYNIDDDKNHSSVTNTVFSTKSQRSNNASLYKPSPSWNSRNTYSRQNSITNQRHNNNHNLHRRPDFVNSSNHRNSGNRHGDYIPRNNFKHQDYTYQNSTNQSSSNQGHTYQNSTNQSSSNQGHTYQNFTNQGSSNQDYTYRNHQDKHPKHYNKNKGYSSGLLQYPNQEEHSKTKRQEKYYRYDNSNTSRMSWEEQKNFMAASVY